MRCCLILQRLQNKFSRRHYNTPPSQQSLSPLSVSSNSSSSNQTSAADWVDTFEIPWGKFSEELMQSLERGKRLSPKMRKEMVRIVVSEMMRKSSYLGNRSSTEAAKKMVAKYPKSLQDVIDGDVIGPGYHSLVKQLQYRIDNVKRSTMPKIRKRKRCCKTSDTDEIPPEQRAAIQDTCGCINWNAKSLPLGETAESQQQKKDKLKMMSLQNEANPEEMKLLMRTTFYSQRKDINQGKSIQDVLETWPLLFHDIEMAVHYKELTGLGLKETFMRNMDMKGKRLLNYMNIVCVNKNKRFFLAQTKLMMVRGELDGYSEDVKEMVLLLFCYFNENEEAMFFCVEDTCLAVEVQMDNASLTPTIIVCGQSCFYAKRFMLSVAQQMGHNNISCFISALCMMFGSYYCLNIHYQLGLASKLEFLQRFEVLFFLLVGS
ncbi:hypothetical protein XENOCAPTIV_024525 [Xenoophorus captivus]|uniref:Uncharacterized protein n=1 Tax=Xenoophorus captivus TaxID=1517983 RepID=A0ABV0R1W6_9TELE